MPFDINRYTIKKKSFIERFKRNLKAYKLKNIRKYRDFNKRQKTGNNPQNIGETSKKLPKWISQLFKTIGLITIGFICLILLFIGFSFISRYYIIHVKYSIPMPQIIGYFIRNKEKNSINICGLENIINENTASLSYTELNCLLGHNVCYENRYSISNLRGVMIFPYSNEYVIKYQDQNKIIISNYVGKTTGEIDLITETVTFTTRSFFDNSPRRIEIITDNEKIKKLEKEIIKKYLQ